VLKGSVIEVNYIGKHALSRDEKMQEHFGEYLTGVLAGESSPRSSSFHRFDSTICSLVV